MIPDIGATSPTQECLGLVLPVTHDAIIAVPTADSSTESSDYETASTISDSSFEPVAQPPPSKFCGLTLHQWKRKLTVKRKFLPAKFSYFTFFGQKSLFSSYFIIYLTSVGLDPSQAGLINGVRMAVITMSGIMWGALADRSSSKIWIFANQIIFSTLFMFISPWVAFFLQEHESATEHRSHIHDAIRQLNTTINTSSNEHLEAKYGLHWPVYHYRTAGTELFVALLLVSAVGAFFDGGRQTLIDIKVLTLTKAQSKSKNAFGKQRSWGSVAYSIIPLCMGIYLEATPETPISIYIPVFVAHALLNISNLVSCCTLFHTKQAHTVEQPPAPVVKKMPGEPGGIREIIKRGVKDYNFFIFFVLVISLGVANGLQWCFQFIFLEELGASKTFMGLCVTCQCVVEALGFLFAAKAVQFIGGSKIAIQVGCIGYGVTFICYYFIRTHEIMPILTSLLGVSYTLFFCSALDELYSLSGEKCRATLHAVYNSLFIGLGNVIAGIAGGYVYKTYGGRFMYLTGGLFYLTIGTIFLVIQMCVKRRNATKAQAITYSKFDVLTPKPSDETAIKTHEDDAISLHDKFECDF